MKRQILFFAFALAISLTLSNCGNGGSVSKNKYLGKLPGIADKYSSELEELEKKAKEATDMDKAFKYAKEAELKEEEADKAIEDYVAENEFTEPIPFEQLADAQYEIQEIMVSGASLERINLKAKVKILEDMKSEYGNPIRNLFVYIKAVNDAGETIGHPTVMASSMGQKDDFTKDNVVELNGSVKYLSELGDLAKIQIISKEEYDKVK
jgi:hypothetical protein